MSTRGCFGVRINSVDKLIYNHADSCPEGLGDEMLETTRGMLKEHGMDWLKEKANLLQMVKGDSVPTKDQIEHLKPYTDLGVSDILRLSARRWKSCIASTRSWNMQKAGRIE